MQAAPSSGGATRGKLPSSKVNAVIVAARNDAGAESACLLRTLRFKVPNDLTTYSMGCHFECDGLHFGCVSHSDVSFAGNPEHLCTWTHDGEARRAVGLDAEKVDDVPINPTRAALLMKMPFAVAVPEWWTLLPLPLTEYRLCVHAKNMLEGLVTRHAGQQAHRGHLRPPHQEHRAAHAVPHQEAAGDAEEGEELRGLRLRAEPQEEKHREEPAGQWFMQRLLQGCTPIEAGLHHHREGGPPCGHAIAPGSSTTIATPSVGICINIPRRARSLDHVGVRDSRLRRARVRRT